MNAATKRYRGKNPLKKLAHDAVGYAIRTGKLERKPCEKCGNPKSQGHHEDYSKLLDVKWLCASCHKKEHRIYVAA